MTTVPVEVLLAAVGIAMSPLSIAAVILVLLRARSGSVGIAYALGWMTGITVVGILILLFGELLLAPESTPRAALLWLKLLVGLVLIGLGAWQLLRPRDDDAAEADPKWMKALDGISVPKAFGFAAMWGSLQPKNLALLVAGMVALLQSGLEPWDTWTVFAIFVLVASISVLVPVGYFVVAGERAQPRLDATERWLVRNGAGVMGGFLIAIGLVLVFGAAQSLQV